MKSRLADLLNRKLFTTFADMEKLNNLKLILVQKGVTVKSLAEQLGVGISTVTKWNSNVNQPETRTVKRICEILGITASDFYTF